MANVSSELNLILNENKDPIEEKKSPLIFILLLIITVVAVYFAVMYFNVRDTKIIKDDGDKFKKIIEENVLLTTQNKKIEEELEKLKKQMVEMLEERIINENENKKAKLKEESKNVEVIKENTNITATNVDKNSFKKIYFSDKSNHLKCYDYSQIATAPTSTCLNELKPFLEKNSNALRFQIIPVLSDNDEKAFSKFDKETKNTLLNGVSTQRVTETIWQVKKMLGNDIIITADSYYVKSEKGNSGFILKAYY